MGTVTTYDVTIAWSRKYEPMGPYLKPVLVKIIGA
jgi:hypothetical protein